MFDIHNPSLKHSKTTGTASGVDGKATRVGVSVCDIACGMYAHSAVLEAIMTQRETGQGTCIDVSLFSSVADWMTVPLLHYESDGKGPSATGLTHPSISPYGAYDTGENTRVLISIQNENEFVDLCERVLERPEIPLDSRFDSNVSRCQSRDEVDQILESTFRELGHVETLRRLDNANIAYAEVNDMKGLSEHEALSRQDVNTEIGPISLISPPVRFNGRHRHFGGVRHTHTY